MVGSAVLEPLFLSGSDVRMAQRKPNFFVVGAPKCGTTALYHTLLKHPEVFLPHSERAADYWRQKEPLHFCDDLGIEDWIRVHREEDYQAMFAGAGDARRAGEVSALYLLSPNAPKRILEFAGDDEDLRFIILLRPPVDWMRSWHQDCLRYAHETITDFREALEAEPWRREGRRMPRHGGFNGCLNYREAAHFSEAVERWYAVFGRERVRVFLMEDLSRDPVAVLDEIADFLDITPGLLQEIERRNDAAVLTRTHHLEFRFQRKLATMPRLDRLAGPLIRRAGRGYRRFMLNRFPPLSNKEIDPAFHESLVAEFRPEVERLAQLIDRDLSHWQRVDRVVAHMPPILEFPLPEAVPLPGKG